MSVLVGLIDQEITSSMAVNWDTNKVGGKPTWLYEGSDPSPPACKLCQRPTTLVSQMYCPLGGSEYHRCIFVFACSGKCGKQSQGWQAFRSMLRDVSFSNDSSSSSTHVESQSSDVWLDDQDDWGVGGDDWGDAWGDDEEGEGDDIGDDCNSVEASRNNKGEFSERKSDIAVADSGDSDVCQAINSQRISDFPVVDAEAACENAPGAIEDSFSKMQVDDTPGTPNSRDCSVSQAEQNSGVTKEDIGLADTERWNAMAGLLNTKHTVSDEMICTPSSFQKDIVTLKSYYLNVIEEPFEELHVTDHVLNLLRDYEKMEGKPVDSLLLHGAKARGKSKGSSETYEKGELRHGDKVFHRFLKRLQRCPEQCVRYHRGSEPLPVADMSGEVVKPCASCGADRVFEFQLLPPLIPWLRALETDSAVSIEFGTVMIFTCKPNCWPQLSRFEPSAPYLLEEEVILQLDPDEHLYR